MRMTDDPWVSRLPTALTARDLDSLRRTMSDLSGKSTPIADLVEKAAEDIRATVNAKREAAIAALLKANGVEVDLENRKLIGWVGILCVPRNSGMAFPETETIIIIPETEKDSIAGLTVAELCERYPHAEVPTTIVGPGVDWAGSARKATR
jgi:hypothetical protein